VRLVLIEWLDSMGCSSSWQDLEDSRATPLVCRSVGWLLHDTDTCKVVVPHITNTSDPNVTPQGCGDMTIPTCAVTRMVELPDLPIDV
jgi:hypothetical protein